MIDDRISIIFKPYNIYYEETNIKLFNKQATHEQNIIHTKFKLDDEFKINKFRILITTI